MTKLPPCPISDSRAELVRSGQKPLSRREKMEYEAWEARRYTQKAAAGRKGAAARISKLNALKEQP